ncbi:hypothetical protein AMYX_03590 [Anaeromyxobacter diazotrophicus]|uniref:Uncharacterized protein n=2 Tax=Anaeromyxobacter diazotrophicus TaxID=2590199 RepID=A0A7I9VHJ7_9BACT|nr:hypothetical protein AMYX_03590 [Anaeromyxobacter diazotrophicus]
MAWGLLVWRVPRRRGFQDRHRTNGVTTMKRAILLFAALSAGVGGCYSRPLPETCGVPGTLTLYWQNPQGGFQANGQLFGCDSGGVASVQVSVNGAVQGVFPCHGPAADGIQLTGYGDERVSVQLDAYDASSHHLYQQVQTVNTTACADTLVDARLPALAGDLTVGYQFTDSPTCAANTYIWYTLLDATRNEVIDEVGPASLNPKAIPCSSVIALQAVPFGHYTVTRIQEIQYTSATTYVSLHDTCSPQSFDHLLPGETQTVLVPPTAGGTCF